MGGLTNLSSRQDDGGRRSVIARRIKVAPASFVIVTMLLLSLLISCTGVDIRPRCWQNAYYQAVVVESELGLPTRIAVGRNRITEGGHAQAQAYINGRWQWLSLSSRPVVVIEDRKDRAWSAIEKPPEFYTKEKVFEMWGRRSDLSRNP